MSIPDGTWRLVFSGDFLNGLEKWAFGLWWTGSGFDFASGEPSTALYVAWRTAFTNVLGSNDHYTRLDSYKYEGGVSVEHHSVDFSHVGAIASNMLPTQCAIALTLRTATSTRSGRGRIYVPYRGPSISGTTGLAQATQVNACVDALAAYLTDMHGLGTTPVVCSQTQSINRTITGVDADLVVDTQRRRRNKMTSARHSAAVT